MEMKYVKSLERSAPHGVDDDEVISVILIPEFSCGTGGHLRSEGVLDVAE